MTASSSFPGRKQAEGTSRDHADCLSPSTDTGLSDCSETDHTSRHVVKVNTVRKFERSETGRAIMPADWDDPEDAIYDKSPAT